MFHVSIKYSTPHQTKSKIENQISNRIRQHLPFINKQNGKVCYESSRRRLAMPDFRGGDRQTPLGPKVKIARRLGTFDPQ